MVFPLEVLDLEDASVEVSDFPIADAGCIVFVFGFNLDFGGIFFFPCDGSKARKDWGFAPRFGFEEAFLMRMMFLGIVLLPICRLSIAA